MWCKFYFKVHLQRGSWNTDWSEMGFPAVRGLTWRTVVLPRVINTWTIWTWQFHFSTSMSNRCSVNPPHGLPVCKMLSTILRLNCCPFMQQGYVIFFHFSVWKPASISSAYSKSSVARSRHSDVYTTKATELSIRTHHGKSPCKRKYLQQGWKDEEINFTDRVSNNLSLYLSLEFPHQVKISHLWPSLNEQPHQLFKAFFYSDNTFFPKVSFSFPPTLHSTPN